MFLVDDSNSSAYPTSCVCVIMYCWDTQIDSFAVRVPLKIDGCYGRLTHGKKTTHRSDVLH